MDDGGASLFILPNEGQDKGGCALHLLNEVLDAAGLYSPLFSMEDWTIVPRGLLH